MKAGKNVIKFGDKYRNLRNLKSQENIIRHKLLHIDKKSSKKLEEKGTLRGNGANEHRSILSWHRDTHRGPTLQEAGVWVPDIEDRAWVLP